MKIFMALMLVVFLSIAPIVSAITLSDTTAIQNSCKSFVDGGQCKKIDVSVLPPDGVIYNITANSENTIFTARLIGVIAFSNLTYYHPEVTKGWIGIFLDDAIHGSNPVFFDIYSSDLLLIGDRRSTSQSEALKVANNIIKQRGTSKTIHEMLAVSTYPSTQSYSNSQSSTTTSKSITSDSSNSNRCDQVVHVKGYTTKKGKYVAPYDRRPPGC